MFSTYDTFFTSVFVMITKKISIKKEENIYNFYYEKVPKTGLNFLFN